MSAPIAIEAAARLFSVGLPVYAPRRFEPEGKVPFTDWPHGLLTYAPGVDFSSLYDTSGDTRSYLKPSGRIDYEINSLGFRGPEVNGWTKPVGVVRVLCLGDSLTFGEGVRLSDTYPTRLEGLLSAGAKGQRFEVINAGVQAMGTPDEVKFFESHCARLKPDVVILQFFLNDAMDFSETIRLNDEQSDALSLSTMGRISRVWEIFERRAHGKRLQEQYFRAIRDSFESPRWRECKDSLAVLASHAAYGSKTRFRLLVVIFPVLWGLDGVYPFGEEHALVRRACEQAGCESLDLLDVFRGRRSEDLWVHPTDQHPNEIAHKLAAEAIAARLSPPK